MKKYFIRTLLIISAVAIMTGCGKKKNTISDNLINDNPQEVQGMDQYADLGNKTPESTEIVDTIYMDPEAGDVSDNSVSEDSLSLSSDSASISADEASLSSDSVSGDSISSDVVTETESDENISLEDIATSNIYTPIESNTLNIANLSGRNLKAIYVTFSAGNLKGSEILGSNKLGDGDVYTYTIDDMDSLRNAGVIKLEITVIDKNEKDINFGSIDIVDPNNMTVVLSHKGKNYYMYQK